MSSSLVLVMSNVEGRYVYISQTLPPHYHNFLSVHFGFLLRNRKALVVMLV